MQKWLLQPPWCRAVQIEMNCKHLSKNNFPNSFFNTKVSKHDCRFRNATFFLEIGRKGEEESKGVCGISIVKKT